MINSSPAALANAKVLLKKSNGQSLAFKDFESAFAKAASGDVLNVLSTLSIADAVTAKSNVTVNVHSGVTLTFAEEISLGAGITNFKIAGGGNLIFTQDAFLLTGIVGMGNEIDVRGDVTVGKVALRQLIEAIQVASTTLKGKNVTIDGEVISDGKKAIAIDNFGASEFDCIIEAEKVLTIPAMRIATVIGNSLSLIADVINISGDHYHCSATVNVVCRVLNLGVSVSFDDADANSAVYTLDVDEINLNHASGLTFSSSLTTITFKRLPRIKNISAANPAHVINEISGSASAVMFLSGAILYTAGGANSKAINSDGGTVVSNGNVFSNKPLAASVTVDVGTFVEDAVLVL